MTQPDLESEKAKYFRIWHVEAYHNSRAAEGFANYLLFHTDSEIGNTAIDLGCGVGRGGKYLSLMSKKRAMDVTLFDLIDARAEEVRDLPFIEGNIWDLPPTVYDYILCCDVLEHVPPQYVDRALDGMAAITRKGGLLSIAHFTASTADWPDAEMIEDLHLTVEPPEWWQPKIESRWQVKEWRDGAQSRVLLGPPR